jgi:hypothetical protein
VHYALANSWPGGFQASVTITNNGPAAVNGWTLTWTWPDSGEAITQMWSASYTQHGTSVSATDAGYDATIGAGGGTVNFGFLGSDTGPAPVPAVFYLNGNVCGNN